MSSYLEIYIILVLCGLLMIGVEIFIPGGVLGLLGGLGLAAAAVIGVWKFPEPYGLLNVVGIIGLSALMIYLWLKYLPETPLGKNLTLKNDSADFKSHADNPVKAGMSGVAKTDLRPSGIATINSKRIDVIAESNWLPKGSPLRVSGVSGSRVLVIESEPPSGERPEPEDSN